MCALGFTPNCGTTLQCFILPWLKAARDGHTDIASAQKRENIQNLIQRFGTKQTLEIISEENQTRNDFVWNGDCSQGRAGSGAAGNHGLTSTQGEDQTLISSSGGGQEKSTAWDVSRPHSSDTSELNSLPALLCYG